LLFPVTQFYFSPFLIIWGASKGVITASFLVFSVLFFGSLVLGRAFCGWIMPCGAMQEIFIRINDQKPKTGKLDMIKFFIWVPWLITLITVVLLAGGYRRADYFFMIGQGISVSNIYMYIPFYIVIFLFLLNSVIFGKRANCHYLCWMSPFMIIGRKLSNLLNLPAIRMNAESHQCISCQTCNKECPMSLDVSTMVKLEQMENSECILCGICVDSCPKSAVGIYFGRIKNR
jgi:polyferredoxin